MAAGQPRGVLHGEADGALDEPRAHLIAALASIGAGALENVRHIEWLEGERQRLESDFEVEHEMVGESAALRQVIALVGKVAASDATVLLLGESGTGKELLARAIHRSSPRAGCPFIVVNCAALSETLLESEMFGYERGAFTGALERRAGRIEVAAGGTLFLDEVGELAMPLQAKLLRVIETKEFERVGGTRPLRVDVRIVAATNRDLQQAVRQGSFRADLFHRLNVIALTTPPLRARRDDITLLASHFAARAARRANRVLVGISPEARSLLVRYDWPGNVRELQNAIERAVLLGDGELVRAEDLPESLLESGTTGTSAPNRYHEGVAEAKRRLIQGAVTEARGNVSEAARLLGLHPNYLHRLMKNLGLKGGEQR
jgi:transcriptional regulator with GAF, ATPase, and Fis domain